MNVLLVETKKEYTKSLCLVLQPQILKGIRSIYLDAQRLSKRTNTLRTFQKLLENIPKWDRTTLAVECERIAHSSNCSYLNELITAVFVCYTKVLTAVQVGEKRASVDLDIPSTETFVHKCYIEAARRFWREPYLLSANVTTLEYQKNLRYCERVINESIDETIRGLLPIQHIMQQYLQDTDCGSSVSSACTDRTDRTDATLTTLRDIIRNNIVSSVQKATPVPSDVGGNAEATLSPKNRVTIEPIVRNMEPYNYTTQQFLQQEDDVVESVDRDPELIEESHNILMSSAPTMIINETPTMVIEDNVTPTVHLGLEEIGVLESQQVDLSGGTAHNTSVYVDDVLESDIPAVTQTTFETADDVAQDFTQRAAQEDAVPVAVVTSPVVEDENIKVITMDSHKSVAKRMLHANENTVPETNVLVDAIPVTVPEEVVQTESIPIALLSTAESLPAPAEVILTESNPVALVSTPESIIAPTKVDHTESIPVALANVTENVTIPAEVISADSIPVALAPTSPVVQTERVPVVELQDFASGVVDNDIVEEMNFTETAPQAQTQEAVALPKELMEERIEKIENVLVKEKLLPELSNTNNPEKNTIDTIKREIRELEESITARHMPLFH